VSQVITANRLADGVVIFADAEGGWVEDFVRAVVYADAAATKAGLERAAEAAARNVLVEPYAIDVVLRNGHYVPKSLREAIRASGPTVRRDLGKQAQGQAPILAQHAPLETSHVSL
jgi:Protein of unknown function (DUF2849)